MKIAAITPSTITRFKQNNNKNKQKAPASIPEQVRTGFAYNGFVSFGERLNRTPENFYAQKFNIENMPDTLKKYLAEDFEERHHMPPAQLQREAFQYLKIADSVEDIKDIYPDEPLFKDLRRITDTRPTQGILLLLKWDAQMSQTPVFKDKENKDLTVYLLKKVYLEGKTLEEINKDFDKDATDAIKKELGVKDKQYFSSTNLRTLGIKYPNLSYYNSFLATRNDKEYIPRKITQTRIVSQETIEKLREASKSWWAGLNEMERSEQIQKMLDGKEMADSTFAKFQGQIMTLAADKMGFSEKLSEIWADKYADENFLEDFQTYAQRSREIMLEFWNKDPEFRTEYSNALQGIIAEFEEAYNNKDSNPEALEKLLNQALEQKSKILTKAQQKIHHKREMQKLAQPSQPKSQQEQQSLQTPQQQTNPKLSPQKQVPAQKPDIDINSPKEINRLYKKREAESMKYFTDTFKKEMLDFVLKNTGFKTRQQIIAINQPNAKELLNIDSDEKLNEIIEDIKDKTEKINQVFNATHTLTAVTNDLILNKVLYDITKDPMVFKFERGDANEYISSNNLEEKVLQAKNTMNQTMKLLAVSMNDKNTEKFYTEYLMPAIQGLIENGFKQYDELKINGADNLYTILGITKVPEKERKNFISKYNAAAKFLYDPANSTEAKEVVKEHMIIQYMHWLQEKDKKRIRQNLFKPNDRIIPPAKINDTNRDYAIDMSSLYSLQEAFKNYMHKTETKYWAADAEKAFMKFALSRTYLTQESLGIFLVTKLDEFDKIMPDVTPKDKEKYHVIANTMTKMLEEDFKKEFPRIATANDKAIAETISELRNDPRVLTNNAETSAFYINTFEIDNLVMKNKDMIEQKYQQYLHQK